MNTLEDILGKPFLENFLKTQKVVVGAENPPRGRFFDKLASLLELFYEKYTKFIEIYNKDGEIFIETVRRMFSHYVKMASKAEVSSLIGSTYAQIDANIRKGKEVNLSDQNFALATKIELKPILPMIKDAIMLGEQSEDYDYLHFDCEEISNLSIGIYQGYLKFFRFADIFNNKLLSSYFDMFEQNNIIVNFGDTVNLKDKADIKRNLQILIDVYMKKYAAFEEMVTYAKFYVEEVFSEELDYTKFKIDLTKLRSNTR
jgi:hypothetical protein